MKQWFVYIIKCKDNSYYTGITNNVERRVYEHNNGAETNSYTYSRRPVELVYSNYFNNPDDAIRFEKQLKGWSRKKKEALIKGDFDLLKVLSKSKKGSHFDKPA